MKKIFKFAMMFVLAGTLNTAFTSCSSDDDDNSSNGSNNNEEKFKDKSYGDAAMNACDDVIIELGNAMKAINNKHTFPIKKLDFVCLILRIWCR